jgi:hypothetical protein
MYTENPEQYLTHRGSLVHPQTNETKEDVSIHTKHDMKIEDMKLESELQQKEWKSCCFELHRESSLFFAKLAISLCIIILCSYQLITLKDCNYQSLYSSLLSSVITFWLSKSK